MRSKKIWILIVWLFVAVNAKAQSGRVIKITGTKFPFEIVQQWIDAYTKTHDGVRFQLSKAIPADSADLLIAAHAFKDRELKDSEIAVAVNRYAQLPIVNHRREGLKALQSKGFTKQDLQNIYFRGNGGDFSVYRRDKNVCASRSFAEKVTGSQLDVAGTLVRGDDGALSDAVKHDVNGISYNNLGLIYNLRTRKVADSIAIIPIDLDENGEIDPDENIYATLDDVLDFLRASDNNNIPQDNVNIVINKNKISNSALHFLDWIITEGQRYNRAYGFLDLDKAVVGYERQLLTAVIKNGIGLTTHK